MATFAVRMLHSRSWDPARPIRNQDDWDIHAAFMDALVEDGFVLLGGPIGENEGALLLVEASDETQVERAWTTIPGFGQGRCASGSSSRG